MSEARWIIVPAAGVGKRMSSTKPKQYLPLAGRAVLQRTLEQMLAVPDIEGIVVVLSDDDSWWTSLEAAQNPRIHTVEGGDTRTDSVISGLQYVLQNTARQSWVFVHDAARPLIQLSDIQRLWDAVYNSGADGGILACPVQDTLKLCGEFSRIDKTIDRQHLWQAQTPQLFRAGELLGALQQSEQSKDGMVAITDEASAMERLGHEPLLVEALHPNLKITRPADLPIAEALLTLQTSPA